MTDPISQEDIKRKRLKQYQQYQDQLEATDKPAKVGKMQGKKSVSIISAKNTPITDLFKKTHKT